MKGYPGQRIRVPVEVPASVLVLVIPFWSFLHSHAYSPFRPDALAIAAGLAATGAAVGWWMHRTRSALLRAVLMAALLLVAVDLTADIFGYHRLTAVLLLGATWVLRSHVARIASAMAIAYGAGTLGFGAQAADTVRRMETVEGEGNPPPLLHLIADEHIGIQGIPEDTGEGAAFQRAVVRFYVERGFRLFTRAYSRYHYTLDALPNALNFAESRRKYGWIGGRSTTIPVPLTRIEYFERLVQLGFDLRIYQPDFLDLCTARNATASFCFTMPVNSPSHLAALNVNAWSRARYLAAFWVANKSSLYSRIWELYENRLRPALASRQIPASRWNWNAHNLGAVGGLRLLQQISHDVETAPVLMGTAFVGHVLLPHSPYHLDENCMPNSEISLLGEPRWLTDQKVSAEQRRALYQAYLPQVRCWNLQLDRLLAVFESRGASDAVVIVHGDHGSRIGTIPKPHSAITEAQMGDYYSTLFAIRGPGIAPGVDTAVVSVKDLLDRFSDSGFRNVAVPSHPAPYVFLDSSKGELNPVPARISGSRTGHPRLPPGG